MSNACTGADGKTVERDKVGPDLVAVIIPARNAHDTLDRTLFSVRGQTHANIEIIVVNDQSTDDTADIVLRHAASDQRVRLVENERCLGVGAARNRGAEEAAANYLTFLDADDLMTEDSVERRLSALIDTGAGMVYCWSAVIDAQDQVMDARVQRQHSGEIFALLAGGNFIGNGSSVMTTRTAFSKAGGYSDALFKADAQGCEDYRFYLDVARHSAVHCVPEFLIGYRETPDNMSSDAVRMMRSMQLVQEDLVRDHPEFGGLVENVRNDLRLHIAMKSLRAGRIASSLKLFAEIGTSLPLRIARFIRRRVAARGKESRMPKGSRFPFCESEKGTAGSACDQAG